MEQLTGVTRYRTNWRGQLILQVEFYMIYDSVTFTESPPPHWRDARVSDLVGTIKGDPF